MAENVGASLPGHLGTTRARAAWFWTKAVARNSTLSGSPLLRYYAPEAHVRGLVWWWLSVALLGIGVCCLALASLGLDARVAMPLVVLAFELVVPVVAAFLLLFVALSLPGGDDWVRRAEASALLDEALRHERAKDAREVAERALALDPHSIRCHVALAHANHTLGEPTKVAGHVRVAIHELGMAIARKSERGGYTRAQTALRDELGDWLDEIERAPR